MVTQELRFKHFVDIQSLDSQIATARDQHNKTHIYFIVNHTGPVYKRNGLKDTWEILDAGEGGRIRGLARQCGKHAPRYNSTNCLN